MATSQASAMRRNAAPQTQSVSAAPKQSPYRKGGKKMPTAPTRLLIRAIRPRRSEVRFIAFKFAIPTALLVLVDALTIGRLPPLSGWLLVRVAVGYLAPWATLAAYVHYARKQWRRRAELKRALGR